LVMIPVPGMPQDVAGLDAGLPQTLGQWVGPVNVWKEGISDRGLEDARFNDELDGFIMAWSGDAGAVGYRGELQKQAVRISL